MITIILKKTNSNSFDAIKSFGFISQNYEANKRYSTFHIG